MPTDKSNVHTLLSASDPRPSLGMLTNGKRATKAGKRGRNRQDTLRMMRNPRTGRFPR